MSTLKLTRFETCDYALMSQDNKLSLIGLFDRIFIQKLPAQHPSMSFVVAAVGKTKSDYTINFIIKNPSGNKINEIVMHVKTNDAGQINIITNLSNLPITEQGIFTIECYEGDVKIGSKELIVSNVPTFQSGKTKN